MVHLASLPQQAAAQRLAPLQQHLHLVRELRPLGRPREACSLGSHSSSRMHLLPLEAGLASSPHSSSSNSSRLRACSRSLTVRLCLRSAATSPANGREAGRSSRLAGTSRTATQMSADVSSAGHSCVLLCRCFFFVERMQGQPNDGTPVAASALHVKLFGVRSEPSWLFTCAVSI